MENNSNIAVKKIRELSSTYTKPHVHSAFDSRCVRKAVTNNDVGNLTRPEDPERDRLLFTKAMRAAALYSALCMKDTLKSPV